MTTGDHGKKGLLLSELQAQEVSWVWGWSNKRNLLKSTREPTRAPEKWLPLREAQRPDEAPWTQPESVPQLPFVLTSTGAAATDTKVCSELL